jgi:SAM-dependent methyltransferase
VDRERSKIRKREMTMRTALSARAKPKRSKRGAVRSDPFGAAYFEKFYLSPATRVTDAGEMRARARLIAAALAHAAIPVRSILDAGCGIGLLRAPFAEVLPRARYTGLDASEYLCARYGWVRGSVADHAPRRPSDLAVCYDVLQYLDDREAARAIANFKRLTRAALYVSALTREDWREHCDRKRTDRAVHLRAGEWYRRRLRRDFRYLGLGIWLRKDVSALLWDLERR